MRDESWHGFALGSVGFLCESFVRGECAQTKHQHQQSIGRDCERRRRSTRVLELSPNNPTYASPITKLNNSITVSL